MVVTGARTGDGTSVVAANLAVALARGGFPTVLVCLDPASPSLRALEAEDAVTVAQLLRSDSVPSCPPVLPSLHVVAATADGDEPLTAAVLPLFNQRLRAIAPYVVVETPSLSIDADAQSWAALAGATLVVVELRRATTASVHEAAALLEPVTPGVAGLVTVPRFRRSRTTGRHDAVRGDDLLASSPRVSDDGDAVAHLHGAQ